MSDVVIIGAGVIGLMTATRLLQKGYSIEIIDAGNDPRQSCEDKENGASFSGGDARHVSITETECPASPLKNIYKSVANGNGGWLAKPINALNIEEKWWAGEFNKLCIENGNKREILGKKISAINKRSLFLWREYIKKYPYLFPEGIGLRDNGILVFFHTKEEQNGDFEWESIVDKKSKAVKLLSRDEVRKSCDIFSKTDLEGIMVDGFSMHIITFLINLIAYLEKKNVRIYWNKKISSLDNLKKANKHIIVCTGAFGNELLDNEKQNTIVKEIKKVIGVWVTIPNPGIHMPFKIKAPPPTGYINATPDNRFGRNMLIMSGGYGFVGNNDYREDSEELVGLHVHFEEEIKKVFPNEYVTALKKGTLDRKRCARPMTPTGMPICKVIGKTMLDGKVIFASGNCAGGFTQAPLIAQKIERLLDNA